MKPPPAPAAPSSAPAPAADTVRTLLAAAFARVEQQYFVIAAGLCLFAALLFASMTDLFPIATRAALAALFSGLAGISLLGYRSLANRRRLIMWLVSLAVVGLIGLVAWTRGLGIASPGLSFLGLMACLAGAMTSRSAGLWLALAGAVVVAVQALGQALDLMPHAAASTGLDVPRLVVLGMTLLAGAAGGQLLSRMLQTHMHQAAEREQRFQALLGIATNLYWETDDQLRLGAIMRRNAGGAFGPMPVAPGAQRLEDMPRVNVDNSLLLSTRQQMQARQPFRDMPFRLMLEDGEHHMLASGEPRFDAEGRFVGYWGVARDVTDSHRDRQALERSQALLSQVLDMSPDVITLTDAASGRYALVNQSFCRMSGHAREQVIGRTSTDIGIWDDLRQRAQLLEQLRLHDRVDDMPIVFRTAAQVAVPMRVSASRYQRDGVQFLVLNARDVSQAERARLEHQAVLAHASVGIVFTRNGLFELLNEQAERMFAAPDGQMLGRRTQEVLANPDQASALRQRQADAYAQGQLLVAEVTLRRLDGSTFLASLRANPVDPAEPHAAGSVWIVEDITQRRQAEVALARARDEAQAASLAKSQFLANTSHELRTPLNGLLGLAHLARAPELDDLRRRQYLEQIADSAQTLSAIITDILDLSKIEAGKLEVERLPFDLHELLNSLHRAYAALARAQGLSSSLELAPGTPQWVLGDAVRLRQILSNLLNNALKFTVAGRVDMRVRTGAGPLLRFEVSDSGSGIDAATQARLFQPFTQADESTTRRYGGTGLGLSICRELATLMGGTVGLTSAPGQGSCFHLELPFPAQEESAPGSGFGALDVELLSGARVLLVEDNPVNMMIAVAVLEQWRIQVSQASDGPQAIAAVAQARQAGRPYDIVLMDVQMPGMSGYEATQLLRQRHSAQELPIIALTAAALVSERERARAAGMTDFLTKPIDLRRLRRALVQALGDV